MDSFKPLVIGIDEVGRGAWAGPLVGAAVVAACDRLSIVVEAGLKDSKKLTPLKRKYLLPAIRSHSEQVIIKEISVERINQIGIGQANAELFELLISEIKEVPGQIKIDGRITLNSPRVYETIIRGDSIEPAIMAASVAAKVYRDELMVDLAKSWPNYRFDLHKGYGTKIHQEALKRHGLCPLHRRNFKPIIKFLN